MEIHVQNLIRRIGGTEVLAGVDFEVNVGEFVALIGRSGCGKSVLLKHIVGLMDPDGGHVFMDGSDITKMTAGELEGVRRRCGFVFQGGALFDSLTVYENLAFALREKSGLREEDIDEKIQRILGEVGLTGAEGKVPAQLSGGMVKRTALARALVMEPEVVFFDEPTTGLDPIIARTMLDLFSNCRRKYNISGIIVSHEIPEIFAIVQKVVMLHDGKTRVAVVEDGKVVTEDPILRQFIKSEAKGPVQYE